MSKFIMVSNEEFQKITKLLTIGEALEWAEKNYEFDFIKYNNSDGVYAMDIDFLVNDYIKQRGVI